MCKAQRKNHTRGKAHIGKSRIKPWQVPSSIQKIHKKPWQSGQVEIDRSLRVAMNRGHPYPPTWKPPNGPNQSSESTPGITLRVTSQVPYHEPFKKIGSTCCHPFSRPPTHTWGMPPSTSWSFAPFPLPHGRSGARHGIGVPRFQAIGLGEVKHLLAAVEGFPLSRLNPILTSNNGFIRLFLENGLM